MTRNLQLFDLDISEPVRLTFLTVMLDTDVAFGVSFIFQVGDLDSVQLIVS